MELLDELGERVFRFRCSDTFAPSEWNRRAFRRGRLFISFVDFGFIIFRCVSLLLFLRAGGDWSGGLVEGILIIIAVCSGNEAVVKKGGFLWCLPSCPPAFKGAACPFEDSKCLINDYLLSWLGEGWKVDEITRIFLVVITVGAFHRAFLFTDG